MSAKEWAEAGKLLAHPPVTDDLPPFEHQNEQDYVLEFRPVTDEQTVAELVSKIEYWGNAPLDTPAEELARRYEDWFTALRAAIAKRSK